MTMVDVRTVSFSEFTKPCQVRTRLASTTSSVAKQPTDPASVPVKNPASSPPITATKMMMTSIPPLANAMILCFQGKYGPGGAFFGSRATTT
jgi:hypothetical protein